MGVKEQDLDIAPAEGWMGPDLGWIKVNINTSYSAATNESGSGFVLCDHSGGTKAVAE